MHKNWKAIPWKLGDDFFYKEKVDQMEWNSKAIGIWIKKITGISVEYHKSPNLKKLVLLELTKKLKDQNFSLRMNV